MLAAAGDVERFVTQPDFILARVHDSEALKRLADAARVTTDAEQRLKRMSELRMALLAEAERILVHDEFPILPVYFYVSSEMVKPKVRGFYSELVGSDGTKRPNLRSIHPLREMSVERAAQAESGAR